jgi:hypothetical protein
MSKDHVMPMGSRRATRDDGLRVFRSVLAVAREFHYTVGWLGTTINGSGQDVDLVIVSAIDCDTPAHKIANLLVKKFADRVLEYEELDELAQTISLTYIQRNKVVVDILIVGLPE